MGDDFYEELEKSIVDKLSKPAVEWLVVIDQWPGTVTDTDRTWHSSEKMNSNQIVARHYHVEFGDERDQGTVL